MTEEQIKAVQDLWKRTARAAYTLKAISKDQKAIAAAYRDAETLSQVLSALPQDAKPEPGVTVTDAMVERGARAICAVYGGNAWGAWKRSARAALIAALQPPVDGE